MPGLSILRIHGHAERPVSDVVALLKSVEHAYSRVYVFEALILNEQQRQRQFGRQSFLWGWYYPAFPRVAPKNFEKLIQSTHQLVLQAAHFSSPGFWDFVAKLNPLEVIRHYLAERHERRKDKKYREGAEEQRLWLENRLLENKVIKERIEIARSMGATDADLIPILNDFIHRPLRELAQHQDSGLIESAELKQLPLGDTETDPRESGQ